MTKFIKYRGAKKVPIVKAVEFSSDKGKKDPRMHVYPRKDWINEGESIPITRKRSNIHETSVKIPPRKK